MNHGIFVRLKNIVAGLGFDGTELTILFMGDKFDLTENAIHTNQESLRKFFNSPLLKIKYCKTKPRDNNRANKFGAVFSAIFDISKTEEFFTEMDTASVEQLSQELQDGYDVLFVHRLASFVPVMKYKIPIKSPILFDLDDIEYLAYFRALAQPPFWGSKFLKYFHLPSIAWATFRALKMSSRSFVCSELDVRKLRSHMNINTAYSLPNSIEKPLSTPHSSCGKTFLFVGTFDYPPNVNAVEFFLNCIWPRIKKAVPNAQFFCAGVNPENIRHYYQSIDGVSFLGYVDALDDLYANSKIVVCPVLSGGGTRVKIIEAAAFGKPVVSTNAGAEGLDFTDQVEIFIAKDSDAFARYCIQLLHSDDMCSKVGTAAKKKYNLLYTKDAFIQNLSAHLHSV